MLKKAIIPSFLIASSFSVFAEEGHLHDTDLQPYRMGAEIFLNGQVFESDFGDLGGGAFATDAPGVDSNVEKGAFTPGNWLQFKPVAPLQFWDGDEWTTAVPNGEHVNIVDALDQTISVDDHDHSDSSAVIGEIDANGKIHTHIDFSLMDASETLNGSQGAYQIQLKLFESAPYSDVSVSYAAKPVVIVFNQGLEEEAFEHAVEAIEGAETKEHGEMHEEVVYDDATGMLSIPEVKALGKHYKVQLQNQGGFLFKLTDADEISESEDHSHHQHQH